MARENYHGGHVYQLIGEPGPGANAVGYVRYSSALQDPATLVTQKRRIREFAERKGWSMVGWYEEAERSALSEEIEQRPLFAQLLKEAGKQFQVVLCYGNSRWSRNMEVAYASLTILRRLHVWWATADGLWDIDKVQQDGFDIAFAVDTQMNASYLRQLSKRTIDGKEDRARAGYHNGKVPFGYLPPVYPGAPEGAGSTWRPPRMPACPDPVNFPALKLIGELAAKGWTDGAIADKLTGYVSMTARFGERQLTKNTIASLRRLWFPREFAPGNGHGTIKTPAGELIEGKHQAAWPYEVWQCMLEVKKSQYRRPRREMQRKNHLFSQIIVCAACRRLLRVASRDKSGLPYYRDTSRERKLPCPTSGNLSIRSSRVIMQFTELLRSVILPNNWRKDLLEYYSVSAGGNVSDGERTASISLLQQAMMIGETWEGMLARWQEGSSEERLDIVRSLLQAGGLIYDLERQSIVGLHPCENVFGLLTLGLQASGGWVQRGDELWLCGYDSNDGASGLAGK